MKRGEVCGWGVSGSTGSEGRESSRVSLDIGGKEQYGSLEEVCRSEGKGISEARVNLG